MVGKFQTVMLFHVWDWLVIEKPRVLKELFCATANELMSFVMVSCALKMLQDVVEYGKYSRAKFSNFV